MWNLRFKIPVLLCRGRTFQVDRAAVGKALKGTFSGSLEEEQGDQGGQGVMREVQGEVTEGARGQILQKGITMVQGRDT